MRARHFIIEYDRAKTWNVHAKGIMDALFKDWSAADGIGDVRAVIKGKYEKPYYDAIQDPGVMAEIMAMIEQGDPTKNKQYSQWLARMYSKNIIPLEDIQSKMFDALSKFHTLKLRKKIKPQHADLNQMKQPVDLLTAMADYEDVEDTNQEVDKGQSAEIYADSSIRVIVPKDEASACYYGRGTKWCTAAKNNNMFKQYHQRGDMYIVLPKNPKHTGEKYQLHLHSKQFMDEEDRPIDLYKFVQEYPTIRDVSVITKWAKYKNVPALMNDDDYKEWKERSQKNLKFAGVSLNSDFYTLNLNAPNGNFINDWTIDSLIELSVMKSQDWSNLGQESGLAYAVIDKKSNDCVAVVAMDYTSSDDYSDGGVFVIGNDDYEDAGSWVREISEVDQMVDDLKNLNQYHYDSTHSLRSDEEFEEKLTQTLDKYGYPMPHTGYSGGEPERA